MNPRERKSQRKEQDLLLNAGTGGRVKEGQRNNLVFWVSLLTLLHWLLFEEHRPRGRQKTSVLQYQEERVKNRRANTDVRRMDTQKLIVLDMPIHRKP